MAGSFYLTLSSNSSMDLFEHNTTANFKVQLPREVYLQGNYEFGLVELHYPCTFCNVREGQNVIDCYHGGESVQLCLKAGYYSSPNDLIGAVNTSLNMIGLPSFSDERDSGYLSVPHVESVLSHRLILSEPLHLQLGFEPWISLTRFDKQQEINRDEKPRRTKRVQRSISAGGTIEEKEDGTKRQIATRSVDTTLGLPAMMLIYCDIAEPQLYSNVVTSIIRTVSIDKISYKYGNMACTTYNRPIYVPVMKRQFQTIEINIRESNGSVMSFSHGTSTLVLHFRPISTSAKE